MTRLRIGKQLERSDQAGAIIQTDLVTKEAGYTVPAPVAESDFVLVQKSDGSIEKVAKPTGLMGYLGNDGVNNKWEARNFGYVFFPRTLIPGFAFINYSTLAFNPSSAVVTMGTYTRVNVSDQPELLDGMFEMYHLTRQTVGGGADGTYSNTFAYNDRVYWYWYSTPGTNASTTVPASRRTFQIFNYQSAYNQYFNGSPNSTTVQAGNVTYHHQAQINPGETFSINFNRQLAQFCVNGNESGGFTRTFAITGIYNFKILKY